AEARVTAAPLLCEPGTAVYRAAAARRRLEVRAADSLRAVGAAGGEEGSPHSRRFAHEGLGRGRCRHRSRAYLEEEGAHPGNTRGTVAYLSPHMVLRSPTGMDGH